MSTLAQPTADNASDPATTPILSATALHKTYRSGGQELPVLRGVDLLVQPGEWLAVLGRSGSGKSTLLHLLGGLDQPDKHSGARPGGSVAFRGQPIGRSGRELERFRGKHVGFVFQQYHLLPELDALENVVVGAMVGDPARYRAQAKATRERAAALLDRVGLSDRAHHRPNRLSGGERQRVAIARALINQPALLLADEPTGNLDAETAGGVIDIIRELHSSGQTIVMVTHEKSVAEQADRRVTLVRGQIG